MKTRLGAEIGMEAAALAYRELVEMVWAQLPADQRVRVMFDPPEREAEMRDWLADARDFSPQVAGDLGARLVAACAGAFADEAGPVAVIGSDCVEMGPELWAETWDSLANHDVVIGPAVDGGYYLLALNQPEPRLFEEIAWSSAGTLRETLARAAECGLRVHLLPVRADVDTASDWTAVQRGRMGAG